MYKCRCLWNIDDEYITDLELTVKPERHDRIYIPISNGRDPNHTYIVDGILLHPKDIDQYDMTLYLSPVDYD